MVDIKLDLCPGSLEPASNHDCFVSVRVGELQKLSRLASSRTYRFPKVGENQQGRIEVFRRIAFYPLDVNPLNNAATQVDLQMGTSDKLGFQVNINATESAKEKAKQAKQQATTDAVSQKTHNAKEYLQQHCIEQKLAEAMQALLRERPENPSDFLANQLRTYTDAPFSPTNKPTAGTSGMLGSNAPATGGLNEALRKEAEKALVQASKDGRLMKALMETQGNAKLAIPDDAWKSIYMKFPAAAAKLVPQPKPAVSALLPFKPYYASNVVNMSAASFSKIYAKFPAKERPKPKAKEESQATSAYDLKPSVGTWLAVTPFNPIVAAAAEDKRALAAEGPKQKWAVMPSSGTWVQPLFFKPAPKPKPVVSALVPFTDYYEANVVDMGAAGFDNIYAKFPPQPKLKPAVSALVPFKPYYGTNVVGDIGAAGFANIYAKFPAKERPKAPKDEAKNESTLAYDLKPSVGTWLAVTPFNPIVAAAAEDKRALAAAGPKQKWAVMPSTGTWVQPLFYKPENTQTPTSTSGKMVVSAHQLYGPNFIGGGLRFI